MARQIGTVVAVDEQTGCDEVRSWAGTTTRTASRSRLRAAGRARATTCSVTTPEQSQLYSLYIADDSHAVWNDEGDLWAFVADGVDSYFDFPFGLNTSVSGKFVKVPKQDRDRTEGRRHRSDGG